MVSFRSNLKKFLTDLESILSYTKTQLTYPNSLKNKYGTPLFMHSCDGLLCFITNISYVILWNPSIRAFKILPPPSKNLRERRYISSSYSFGYDRFIDDYKIVAISFFKDKVEVNIYTLGRNSWRRIQEFPHCSSIRGPGVFVSGTVNWLTFYDSSSTSCAIVSLDLEEESYQKLSQPDLEKNHWTLGVLDDCLCIFSSGDTFFDVWIMMEYGNKESWTKLYHVPCMRDQDLVGTLYISKDDLFLMDFFYDLESFKLKLVVYDCKKSTLKILESSKINNLDEPKSLH
jgi:F-box interacting protein